MFDLSPRSAGSTEVALAIAKRILSLDGLDPVRRVMYDHTLHAFCKFVAREVDRELANFSTEELTSLYHGFVFTPSEQGKFDAEDAIFRAFVFLPHKE